MFRRQHFLHFDLPSINDLRPGYVYIWVLFYVVILRSCCSVEDIHVFNVSFRMRRCNDLSSSLTLRGQREGKAGVFGFKERAPCSFSENEIWKLRILTHNLLLFVLVLNGIEKKRVLFSWGYAVLAHHDALEIRLCAKNRLQVVYVWTQFSPEP